MNNIRNILFVFIVLATHSALADTLIVSDIGNDCGNAYSYSAVYDIDTYDCAPGYYLPAGAVECTVCPDDYVCDGGTFNFSASQTQGLNAGDILLTNALGSCGADDFNQSLSAIFEPNVYDCAPGYYLPAGNDWINDTEGCRICSNDNYCPGGVYVFNETQNQGLVSCPESHPFAPGGMWLESQCGRKMHVGDDVLYLHIAPAVPTVKRLYVRFNDVVYSANATEKEFAPATMSERATRALHVLIDGVEYLIHDDSAR